MMDVRIVGIDPGFANVGIAVLDYLSVGGSSIVHTRLVTTSPTKGKAGSIDDEIRRLQEIEDELADVISSYGPAAVVIEEPGKCLMRRFNSVTKRQEWATNPATLRTSCMMWGAVHGMCGAHNLPCVKVRAKDIKQEVCGKKNASKAEIVEAVKAMYPGYTDWLKTKKVEHICDAVGAAITGAKGSRIGEIIRRARVSGEDGIKAKRKKKKTSKKKKNKKKKK